MGYIEHNTYEEMLMQYGVALPNVGVEARILAAFHAPHFKQRGSR